MSAYFWFSPSLYGVPCHRRLGSHPTRHGKCPQVKNRNFAPSHYGSAYYFKKVNQEIHLVFFNRAITLDREGARTLLKDPPDNIRGLSNGYTEKDLAMIRKSDQMRRHLFKEDTQHFAAAEKREFRARSLQRHTAIDEERRENTRSLSINRSNQRFENKEFRTSRQVTQRGQATGRNRHLTRQDSVRGRSIDRQAREMRRREVDHPTGLRKIEKNRRNSQKQDRKTSDRLLSRQENEVHRQRREDSTSNWRNVLGPDSPGQRRPDTNKQEVDFNRRVFTERRMAPEAGKSPQHRRDIDRSDRIDIRRDDARLHGSPMQWNSPSRRVNQRQSSERLDQNGMAEDRVQHKRKESEGRKFDSQRREVREYTSFDAISRGRSDERNENNKAARDNNLERRQSARLHLEKRELHRIDHQRVDVTNRQQSQRFDRSERRADIRSHSMDFADTRRVLQLEYSRARLDRSQTQSYNLRSQRREGRHEIGDTYRQIQEKRDFEYGESRNSVQERRVAESRRVVQREVGSRARLEMSQTHTNNLKSQRREERLERDTDRHILERRGVEYKSSSRNSVQERRDSRHKVQRAVVSHNHQERSQTRLDDESSLRREDRLERGGIERHIQERRGAEYRSSSRNSVQERRDSSRVIQRKVDVRARQEKSLARSNEMRNQRSEDRLEISSKDRRIQERRDVEHPTSQNSGQKRRVLDSKVSRTLKRELDSRTRQETSLTSQSQRKEDISFSSRRDTRQAVDSARKLAKRSRYLLNFIAEVKGYQGYHSGDLGQEKTHKNGNGNLASTISLENRQVI